MNCPKCGSEKVQRLNRGAKGAAVVGGISAFTGTAKGAVTGATIGSFVPVIGTFIGGTLGALTGAIAGASTGAMLDSKVLNNRKCNFCNHEWHE